MFTGDFHQFQNLYVKVTCNDGREYIGIATSFDDHDDTSLPGADCIQFAEPNTGRRADFFRAEIKDITVICPEKQFVEVVDGGSDN